jgi:hypothetical protein
MKTAAAVGEHRPSVLATRYAQRGNGMHDDALRRS